MGAPAPSRRAWATVDLDAIAHNAALLAEFVSPSGLCAVVKADAYGHGAVPVARAALAGGASWLAVAVVEEGIELRDAGIEVPILVLSEAPSAVLPALVAHRLSPTVGSHEGLADLVRVVSAQGADVGAHLKVDTGMHRIGVAPEDALAVAKEMDGARGVVLEGVWSHLALAERMEDRATVSQVALFASVLDQLHSGGITPKIRHLANSGGAVLPAARLDMVRCGIALYGYAPSPALAEALPELRPAMEVSAEVSFVAEHEAGERPSYGRRRPLPNRARVATLPLGYADGVPWRLFDGGGEVLIGGRRCELAGSVTMDQTVVDCSNYPEVARGCEAVLIGQRPPEAITAQEWADRAGSIVWEILARIGPRLPRRYKGALAPAGSPSAHRR